MSRTPFLSLLLVSSICGFALACSSPGPGQAKAPSVSPAVEDPGLNIDDPTACEDCHETVVAEWRESMHARAHHANDPIYAGVRALRMGKEGEQIANACALCHTPRAGADHEAEVAKVGVGCAACHNAARVHAQAARKGSKALEYAGGTLLLGPHDLEPGAEEAHQTGPAPAHMRDATALCLACHDELMSAAGIPICSTGPEAKQGRGAKEGCTSCHMARVKGASGGASELTDHASHAFAGPHRAWYQDDTSVLARAVQVLAFFSPGALTVEIENRTGHALPTGFPGRTLIMQAIFYDGKGVEVGRAWTSDPVADSPSLVLHKVYVDAQGKPTLAPYGVDLRRDTRLRADEKRVIELPAPASARRAVVSLHARLLPAPLAEKIGIGAAPEAEAKKVVEVEAVRAD